MKYLFSFFLLTCSWLSLANNSSDTAVQLIGKLGYQASIAQNEGRYPESEAMRAQLVSLMRVSNAPKVELARQLSNLASIQNHNLKGEEAEQSALEAFEILASYPTSDQVQIAVLNGNLAGALLLQNKLEASRKYYLKELAILKQIGQQDSHFAASARIGIGAIEAKLGNFDKAKALYEDALDVFLKISDETHPLTRRYLQELEAIKRSLKEILGSS